MELRINIPYKISNLVHGDGGHKWSCRWQQMFASCLGDADEPALPACPCRQLGPLGITATWECMLVMEKLKRKM